MRTSIGLIPLICILCFTSIAPAPPVPKTRPEAQLPITAEMLKSAKNRLQQIGLAFHNYQDVKGHLPNNVWDAKGGKKLLSWRVQILPYIEQEALYKEFKQDEPWDSEHNKKLIAKIPAVYVPLRGKAEAGSTFLQAFAGESEFMMPKGEQIGLVNITDGTSNTLMVVQAGEAVPWTKPDDIAVDPKKDFPKLGGEFNGTFLGVMCDGAVYRFKKEIPHQQLRALATIAGGEIIDSLEKITEPLEGGDEKQSPIVSKVPTPIR